MRWQRKPSTNRATIALVIIFMGWHNSMLGMCPVLLPPSLISSSNPTYLSPKGAPSACMHCPHKTQDPLCHCIIHLEIVFFFFLLNLINFFNGKIVMLREKQLYICFFLIFFSFFLYIFLKKKYFFIFYALNIYHYTLGLFI
jgi:hypothetical protein